MDFKYEANINLNLLKDYKIKDVQFLMPVNIEIEVDGATKNVSANVDLARQVVHIENPLYNSDKFKSDVLSFVRQKSVLPEDTFEANEETYNDVNDAQQQQEIIENVLQEEE